VMLGNLFREGFDITARLAPTHRRALA
jgi:hypothetical protein